VGGRQLSVRRARRPFAATRPLAALAAAAALAVPLAAALLPAAGAGAAQASGPPGPVVVVLVRSWTVEQARALAERTRFDGPNQVPAAAGLVSTLPADASFESRVLSLAGGARVDAKALRGGTSPAALETLRADNPGAAFSGLPPVRVLADPGLERAGLFGMGAGAPVDAAVLDPTRPLVVAVPQAGQDALTVLAVPDAARLAAVVGPLLRVGRVLAVGLEPPPGRARTAPYLELGGEAGLVTSDGTRRAGLVALEDVRATVQAGFGRAGERGTPSRVVATADPLGEVTVLDRRVAALVKARSLAVPLAAALAVLAGGLAVAARSRPRLAGTARELVLLALAVPCGYLVASVVAPPDGGAWLGLGLAVAVVLALAAGRAGRAAPAVLGLVLLALVAADLASGSEGLSRPLLGGSAYDGERFYGLGNGYFAYTLAAAALVVAFLPLRRPGAVALFVALALLDGLPALGADVGGALASMLTAAAALVLLDRRPVRGRRVALVAAGAVVAGLAVALGTGAVTGEATHASRFAGEVAGGGPAVAIRVFAHKLEVNAALLAGNPFAWAGPLATVLAGVLAYRWRPPTSAAAPAAAPEPGWAPGPDGPPAREALAPWPAPGGTQTKVVGQAAPADAPASDDQDAGTRPDPAPTPARLGARERVRRAVLVGVAGSVALIVLNDTGVTAAAGSGMFLLLALLWAWLPPRRVPDGPS
jgi:hypothetical protein